MTKARTLADNFAADINGITAGTGITGGGTSGTVTITNDMATTIAAKGDLLAGTANDAYAALTVGANNTVLTADSSTATGLKWAAVAATKNFSLLNSGGTALNGASTVTVSGLSGYDSLLVRVDSAGKLNTRMQITIRFNADTGSNYYFKGIAFDESASPFYLTGGNYPSATSSFNFGDTGASGQCYVNGAIMLTGCNTTGVKVGTLNQGIDGSAQYTVSNSATGIYTGTSVISSVSIIGTTTFDANGTIFVYGAV